MRDILTDEQVEALVTAPDLRTRQGYRDRAFLSIMAYGGLRIQEACSLRRDEVQTSDGRTRLTFVGKGGKKRTVALPQRAVSPLIKHLASHRSAYVFPGRDGLPVRPRGGSYIVERAVEAAGLPSWIHPHALRHYYGSKLMRETGDLFLVSRVLGHSNMNTTARFYLAFDPTYADRAAEVWK